MTFYYKSSIPPGNPPRHRANTKWIPWQKVPWKAQKVPSRQNAPIGPIPGFAINSSLRAWARALELPPCPLSFGTLTLSHPDRGEVSKNKEKQVTYLLCTVHSSFRPVDNSEGKETRKATTTTPLCYNAVFHRALLPLIPAP